MSFPLPDVWADFNLSSGSDSFIFNKTQYPSFSSWLTAAGGSFTRNSTAYYTNSSGLLTQASSGAIRFDYDPVLLTPKGALLEGTGTNLALQSGTLTAGTWFTNAATITGGITGPDGSASAFHIVEDNTTNGHYAATGLSGSISATNTFSAYIKPAERSFAFLSDGNGNFAWFNLSGSGVVQSGNGTITQFSNGWYRCTLTVFYATPTAVNILIGISKDSSQTFFYAGSAGNGIYATFAQVEKSIGVTSYIPTAATSVTRSADSFIASSVTPTSATVFAEWTPELLGLDPMFSGNGIWQIATNNAGMDVFNTSGELAFRGTGINVDIGVEATSGDNRQAAAFAVGNVNVVSNGGAAFFSSALSTMPSGNLLIGSARNTNSLYGWMSKFGYWSSLFTVDQLQRVTSGPIVFQHINPVNTQSVLTLPIDFVLAGQQIEETPRKFPVDMFGILKRIFRE